MSNYISTINTETHIIHSYHRNIIIFQNIKFTDFIFPGLFHELKIKSKHPDIFKDIKSAPSRYLLPQNINADNLIKKIKSSISTSLLFIHTWIEENNQQDLLNNEYSDYNSFFEQILLFIINNESNQTIKDLAIDIKASISKYYKYLGSYHGSMKEIIFKRHDLGNFILFMIYSALLCNTFLR